MCFSPSANAGAFPASTARAAPVDDSSRRRDRRRHHGLGNRHVAGGCRHSVRIDRTGTRRTGTRPRAIRENYAGSCSAAVSRPAAAQEREALVKGSLSVDAASDVDLVIEAVFEDFDLKRSVLAQLDAIVRPDAILASNTSSLSLTSLASASRHPERVIGLHFFSPANVMRLLEIVRGAQTSEATILAGLALAKKLRKVGVVVGDGFGFVGNRMMLDGYFREVELMLLQDVPPERIDSVMERFGFAMGPNRVNDMAGIDVGTRVRAELIKRESRQPPYHVVSDALTALGHLGQKTGRGIYRYETGNRAPLPDPEVLLLTRALAAKHGIEPRDVSDAEIEQRCVLSLINIGAQILDEGLAYRAADIDVVWTSGYGFPRWRGGPMFYADTLGIEQVVAQIEALAATGGGDYWRVAPLLRRLAAERAQLRRPGSPAGTLDCNRGYSMYYLLLSPSGGRGVARAGCNHRGGSGRHVPGASAARGAHRCRRARTSQS